MVHVGEAAFYKQVSDDALDHDVVLVEGMRSPIATRVTRSYRWIDCERLGLIIQPRVPDSRSCRAKIVLADLTHNEFLPAWRRVPLWHRGLVYLLAPLVGLHRRVFATREKLAERLSLDDQPSQDELINMGPEEGMLHDAILQARDERLLERLREQLTAEGQARRLAVVYGARHMRAVIRELTVRQGYIATQANWMTIFAL